MRREAAMDAAASAMRVPAHILFSRSPLVGALLLAAAATSPRALAGGVGAIAAASVVARLLELDADAQRAGDYAYSAFLVGLGVAETFGLGAPPLAILLCGSAACVLATAAMRAWLAPTSLPVLSLPFVVSLWLVLGAAPLLGLSPLPHVGDPSVLAAHLPSWVALFLESLGGLFFLPRADAGAIVLVALAVHSRIATLLAFLAFVAVQLLVASMPTLEGVSVVSLAYNAMLVAMTLGGVFFVPSPASFALAGLGTLVSALGSIGLAAPFARLGVPVSILPFNATVLLVLLALRQRRRDLHPKAVDFLAGTPEDNLAFYRTRRARFEQLYPVAFTLPVRGVWTCTQGVDGAFTHQGQWRHAFDLEVRDEDGSFHKADGASNDDYHAFRLPVLAAAAGTVVAVEDRLADNAVGAVDVARNWGNHVILRHDVGLFSLVAHLARGSVKVTVGQMVQRGEQLGLVGSSGRSPRPHLHFQLQGTAALGAPTLPCQLANVVRIEDGGRTSRLHASHVLQEGDAVRSLIVGDEIGAHLGLVPGARWAFQIGERVERVVAELDLVGRSVLRSEDRAATLFYGIGDGFFTTFDVLGDKASVLRLLRAALPRVPLEANEAMVWTDRLPARDLRPLLGRLLFDVLSPFLARDSVALTLRARRDGARLVVEGSSDASDRRGRPLVSTRAELRRGVGIERVTVTVRGRALCAERVPEQAAVRRDFAVATAPLALTAVQD